jgi:lipopolysaccharide transport system ATP-binding protein
MGFHPDFTGRENARMNAAILGLSGPQIRQRLPLIRDFAELSEFFDQPVRTYSSGMALRLAFAVATHADAEILIVDEALAVGDGYFQKKSIDRIAEFHRRGGTLLFCSHALYYVAMVCDEAIWLRNGAVAARGAALSVVRRYEAFLQERERSLLQGRDPVSSAAPTPEALAEPTDGQKPARLTEVVVHDGSGYPRTEFASGETVAVDVEFETSDPRLAFHVRVGVDREDGVQAFAVDSRSEPWSPLTGRDRYRVRLSFPRLPVAQGDFRVYVYLGDEKALHVHDVRILKPGFSVASSDYVVGLLKPEHEWAFPELDAAEPVAAPGPGRGRTAAAP